MRQWGYTHCLMHFKVQVWIYCKDLLNVRRVLLLKTNSKRGSFWQPVTGSVDPGETLGAAAMREAQEETGIDFKEGPSALGYSFSFKNERWGEIQESTFAIESPTREGTMVEPKLSNEHTEFQWVMPEDAISLLKFPSNQEGLKHLVKFWRKS